MKYFGLFIGIYGVTFVFVLIYLLQRLIPYTLGVIANFQKFM